jgi:hypothetical protein
LSTKPESETTFSTEKLKPLLIASKLPPLPKERWLSALPSPGAMAKWLQLRKEFFCTLGHDNEGYYIRCDPEHYEVIDGNNQSGTTGSNR